jgi:hypothetical protein
MGDNHALILPVFYLGNIQYWSKLVHQKNIIFNDVENYPKGSFRNRCHIVSSQGLLRLSIPLVGGKHAGQKYTEVKIDQKENWQKKHWQSLCTCYGSAPFFHHYADKLQAIYNRPFMYLWEWNLSLTNHRQSGCISRQQASDPVTVTHSLVFFMSVSSLSQIGVMCVDLPV